MNIKETIKILLSILLCVLIIIGTFALVTITVLRTTVFSRNYYLQILKSDTYIQLVEDAIEWDVSAQSSYVGIPSETLLAGLDSQILKSQLNAYMINTADYLNFRDDLMPPDYPADSFTPALTAFIEADAKNNNYIPSAEQHVLLAEVAKDTSEIIEKHINLFQLNLFNEATAFKKLHGQIYGISTLGLYVLFAWLSAITCLFFINRGQKRKWLLYLLTSLWLVGTMISVPAIILNLFNLVQRLAIDTPYIKYAFEMLLTSFIGRFLNLGLVLFLLSSLGLIYRVYGKRTLDSPS